MPSPTSCPRCAASLQIPASARGRKMSCPHCGQALVITSAGVAKRGEGHAAAPAARGFPWLLLALALLLTISAIIVGIIALRRHEPPHEQLAAKNHDDPKRSTENGPDHVPVPPEPVKALPKKEEPPKKEPEEAKITPKKEPEESKTLPKKKPEEPKITPKTEPEKVPPLPPPPVEKKKLENLIVNGSFELGPVPPEDWGVPLDAGSTAIPGWTVINGQIDYITSFWKAAHGGRSLDLHGSPGFGGIMQPFRTKVGTRYRVIFALAGNPVGDASIMRLIVSAAGQTKEFEFDTTGKTQDDMGWQDMTWEFQAVGPQTILLFQSLLEGDPVRGPALDNVRVYAVPPDNKR